MVGSDLPQIGMATRGVSSHSHVANGLHATDTDTALRE